MNHYWFLGLLFLATAVQSGESVKEQSLELQWKAEMRAYGTHPDTIKMFLEAEECATIDTAKAFEGTMVPHIRFRRIGPLGLRGYLCEVTSRKKIQENGLEYWQYVIILDKVFDITDNPKQ